MERSKELSMDQAFLQKLTDSVFDNLTNEQFGVEELASDIGMSRSQIHRKLQKINGQSVTQFIREIRLKEAHRLLEEDIGTASEISYKVGFGSPTYFSKCFNEFYGYTPGEVKERQNLSSSKKGLIAAKYLWPSLIFLLLLVIIYFSYLFLPGNYTKTSDPVVTQNEDVLAVKSIAAIPFEFIGEDSTYYYYSAGMVTEILNHLYKIGGLHVKSDIQSRKFANTELSAKELGEAFGVTYILTGSILVAGETIRITPRLLDARTNKILWTDSFTGRFSKVSEITVIQSDVAKKVAIESKVAISPEAEALIEGNRVTDNNLAYEYYLKGQEYWRSKTDYNLAIEMFSKALEADSSFALAYASRAIMHLHAYAAKRSDDWLDHDPLAMADIQKAKQLDPACIEGEIAQIAYNSALLREYEQSLEILNDLKKKMPNMAELYGYSAAIMRRQGKWHESIIEHEKAIQLEPFHVKYRHLLATTYRTLRQFDMAIEVGRTGLERVPDHELFRERIVQAAWKKTGNMDFALEVAGLEEKDMQFQYYLFSRQFEKLIQLVIKENLSLSGPNNFHPKNHDLALFHHYNGDIAISKIYADSAIQLLEEKLAENPLDHRLPIPLGKCYAILGDREKAIAYGELGIRMLPVEKDALLGIGKETELPKIYVLLGEYDIAMDQIEYLLSVPGWLTAGDLWIRPDYYDLRQFPRFHEILRAHQPDSLYQLMINQGI